MNINFNTASNINRGISVKMLTVLVMMFLMGGARAGNQDDNGNVIISGYSDTCNYTGNYVRCGDKCMYYASKCLCGSSDPLWLKRGDDQCCIPTGGNCNREPGKWSDAICSEGKTLSKSILSYAHCENKNRAMQCYNSYQDSQHISADSHYTCPHTCVPVEDMCQGVRWCESDHEVCGPQLRCPSKKKHNLTSSSAVSRHHYCVRRTSTATIDNEVFESIDRIDESKIKTHGSGLDIDITSFTFCNASNQYTRSTPGVKCGPDPEDCREIDRWCIERRADTCDTENNRTVRTTDSRLCSNPKVWSTFPCSQYIGGQIVNYGLRCRGNNMQCAYPWYGRFDGKIEFWGHVFQCEDKSDQVFKTNVTCRQHFQENIDFHNQHFCNTSVIFQPRVDAKAKLICTNKTKYLSYHLDNPLYSDPHSCQSSCSDPGPDCVACTNSSYFKCSKSGQCIHPDLRCDGHPQCREGEDEDLEMCHHKYIENKFLEPFATYKCESLFYKDMDIYATPRNNKRECWDGSDEPETENKMTNYILFLSATAIMILYVALRYSGKMLKKVLSENQEIATNDISKVVLENSKTQEFDTNVLHLINYEVNHEKEEAIDNTNIHILNSIASQTVEANKNTCSLFYDLEVKIHGQNESEIHFCLHKKLDPKVVQNILDSKFPGVTDKCINFLENLAGKRFIMMLQDRIKKSENIKKTIGLIVGIIKVEAKYVDMFKDFSLSILMLDAIGGYTAVIHLPTNFSCVIVMLLFGSIIIPLFLSTLHLVVNRKKIITESNTSRMRKYITIILCWILSLLNPIILNAYYHELKEDVRKMTQNYNTDVIRIQKKCRNIKKEVVQFHKIELG